MKALLSITIFLLLPTLSSGSFAFDSIKARTSHTDAEGHYRLNAISATNQVIELNSNISLVVELSDQNIPKQNALITWNLDQTIDFDSSRKGAYFLEGSNPIAITTNSQGQSTITLNSGEVADDFFVTATASIILSSQETISLIQTFRLSTGAEASVQPLTPERSIATTFDAICPELQASDASLSESEQIFLVRCDEMQKALSDGKTQEVTLMLREISPEEVSIQADVGAGFTNQQVANVASRLSAVRQGTTAISFNQFNMSLDEFHLPSNLISHFLTSALNVSENENDIINSLLNNRFSLFANGNLSLGKRDGTSREDGFDYDSYGVTVGGDYRFEPGTFGGVSLGISKSEVQVSNQGGKLDANAYSLGIFGTHYLYDAIYIDGIINLGINNYDMSRNINYDLNNNPVDRTAISSTSGIQNGFSVSTGYEGNDGPISYTLYGRLNYTRTMIDKFSETGAQEFNINIGEQNVDSLLSNVGVQLSFAHSTRWGVILPFIWLNWDHEFSAQTNEINGSFVDQQFNSNFTIVTDKTDNNYFSSGQGLSAVLPYGIAAYIRLENIVGKEHYSITNISFGGRFELTF